uniref:C-type lectin domain-containing protein n=1 Tax=Esox lucius TaxID=8010 RepID=A0AAY5L3B3_ESOLU
VVCLCVSVCPLLDAVAGAENPTDMEAGVEPQPSCPAGWHQNGHRCFSFYPVWATWVSAESYCSQRGGNLASVHSPDQQVFIQDLVRKHTDQPVWIGGYNVAQVQRENPRLVSGYMTVRG